ncbi:MAG: ABC transporter ATP-binding protein [Syntrophaceae bacterium]
MHSIYQLSDVGYRYHASIPALSKINLTIQPGESLSILGANGSGKSTLLHLLDGLIFPTAGTMTAFGEVLTEEKLETNAFRRFFRSRVGFVFQNPDIQLFCPTVFDEVAFGPLQLDLPAGEVLRRVDDVLNMLGITALKDRTPSQLSGGEKKRVAIASVLSLNPQVLLLDEPTNSLDLRTRHWLIGLISELKQAGKTIITTTHDISIIDKISARVLVMDEDHTLAADGDPAAIISNHELLHRANIIHEHETGLPGHAHLQDEANHGKKVVNLALASKHDKK